MALLQCSSSLEQTNHAHTRKQLQTLLTQHSTYVKFIYTANKILRTLTEIDAWIVPLYYLAMMFHLKPLNIYSVRLNTQKLSENQVQAANVLEHKISFYGTNINAALRYFNERPYKVPFSATSVQTQGSRVLKAQKRYTFTSMVLMEEGWWQAEAQHFVSTLSK